MGSLVDKDHGQKAKKLRFFGRLVIAKSESKILNDNVNTPSNVYHFQILF